MAGEDRFVYLVGCAGYEGLTRVDVRYPWQAEILPVETDHDKILRNRVAAQLGEQLTGPVIRLEDPDSDPATVIERYCPSGVQQEWRDAPVEVSE